MTVGEAKPSVPDEGPERPGTRPRSLVAGVGLIALWWFGSVGAVVVSEFTGRPESDDWTALGALGFWTLVVSAMLRATWRGGPISWWFLSKVSTGFGVIIMAGGLLLGPLVFFDDDAPTLELVLLLGLPFAGGGILFAAGYLLRREDAQRWCRVVPGASTPTA